MAATRNGKAIIFVGLGILVPMIVATVYVVFPSIGNRMGRPATMLQPGWQFYPKPTMLEPPGTVFRIDPEGRRFIVHVLELETKKGRELFGAGRETVRTTANILAGVIGKTEEASVEQEGHKVVALELELTDVVREVTTDMGVDAMMGPLTRVLLSPPNKIRVDNKYYIIREARSAREIHYALSTELVTRLGGKASLAEFATTRADFEYVSGDRFSISQRLPRRMRVMFLADEVAFDWFVVSEPQLAGVRGTEPVTEPLVWKTAEPRDQN